jgi:hypothetical protein
LNTSHMSRSDVFFFILDPSQSLELTGRYLGDNDLPPTNYTGNASSEFKIRQETVLREASRRIRRHLGMAQGERMDKPLIVIINKYDLWKMDQSIIMCKEPYHLEGEEPRLSIDIKQIEHVSNVLEHVLRSDYPEFTSAADALSEAVIYIPFSGLNLSPNCSENITGSSSGLRPHNSLARWSAIPLLYSLAKGVPGLIASVK